MESKKSNFIEVETVEEANRISLDDYSFIKYSETKNRYLFKIRERKAK